MSGWEGLAFVSTPGDVIPSAIPPWITKLAIQVAWGLQQPLYPISPEKRAELEQQYQLYAWAWCQGPDCEAEARYHAECAQGYAGFIANQEEPYDAHGNSQDTRYEYPARYLGALLWSGPLGLTTTPRFGSHMVDWQIARAVVMPQAFPLENGASIADTVAHMASWGWPSEQIRPLAQCYPTNGQRPDPALMNIEATELGVGAVPYTIEQTLDDNGQGWLTAMRPSIERVTQADTEPPPEPTPEPEPEPEPSVGTLIGSQHGITAMADFWRSEWPSKTNQNRDPDNLSTWGAIDKLERTLKILAQDHDANLDA